MRRKDNTSFVWVTQVKLLAAVSSERILFFASEQEEQREQRGFTSTTSTSADLSFNSSCLQRQLSVRRFDSEQRCNDSQAQPSQKHVPIYQPGCFESVFEFEEMLLNPEKLLTCPHRLSSRNSAVVHWADNWPKQKVKLLLPKVPLFKKKTAARYKLFMSSSLFISPTEVILPLVFLCSHHTDCVRKSRAASHTLQDDVITW